MDQLSQEIIIIIGIALSLMIVAIGIVSLFLLYRNKQLQLLQEKEGMQNNFQRQLLEAQLEMQEQTFNLISREIHDNVGQILSLAKVQLNIIDQSKSLDQSLFSDIKDNVSKAMNDLRDIAKSLNSERIQALSLPAIVQEEIQRINRSGLMTSNLQITGEEQAIHEQKKLIIFRIIQESLQNILKHSEATKIEICLSYEPAVINIRISDNGKGFDKSLLSKKDGMGIQNLFKRADLIGGKADIQSIINEGTTITLTAPYA